MSTTINAGRIFVTTAAGKTIFDTDEKLFVVTNRSQGSHTYSSVTASYTDNSGDPDDNDFINLTDTVSLDTVNASATTVRGVFKVTAIGTGSAGGVTDHGWFNAGGTYIHYQYKSQNVPSSNLDLGSRMYALTFRVVGSDLQIHRRVTLQADKLSGGFSSVTMASIKIDYDLLVGTFI